MKSERYKQMKELLGEGYTLGEIERCLEEDPQLGAAAENLHHALRSVQERPIPPLPMDFSKAIAASLSLTISQHRTARFQWRRYAVALALAASVVLAIWGGQRFWQRQSLTPGLAVKELKTSGGTPTYEVSFVVREPSADKIFLAGDFNQWQPLPMQRRGEVFWAQVTLKPGEFLYSYWIDEQKWSPLQAPIVAPDEWGSNNGWLKL